MTADEFLAFKGEFDTDYELIDGVVVARPLAGEAHGAIMGNAAGEVVRRLDACPPCRAALATGLPLDERNFFTADLVATRAEPDASLYIRDPFLILEVLSPETAKNDLAVKLPRYIEMPSVIEVWLVDSRERWGQVWRRAGEGWVVTLPLHGSATFRSDALGDEIALDGLYRNTGL